MKTSAYIVVSADGKMDLRKTDAFQLGTDQVAFRLDVEIPDEAFKPKPVPTITMRVPAEALIRTVEIDAGGTQ